ncbi:MAG: HAD family hydrolase [Candidatus Thorarchaeota archaeon]
MSIRLVVFDVDGTLTKHSSIWWRLHELFGTTVKGKIYYDQYFAGEISYDQWADYDAALWKGKPVEPVIETVRAAKLVPGALETISILKENKIDSAILSGGLDIMADEIGRRLGIDYVLTNKLHQRDGLLTGTVDNLVAWGEKAKEIGKITDHFGVSLDETAFVGDGRNDVSVFEIVRLSIAFNPEDQQVADAADVVVREDDLRSILPHIISGFQR